MKSNRSSVWLISNTDRHKHPQKRFGRTWWRSHSEFRQSYWWSRRLPETLGALRWTSFWLSLMHKVSGFHTVEALQLWRLGVLARASLSKRWRVKHRHYATEEHKNTTREMHENSFATAESIQCTWPPYRKRASLEFSSWNFCCPNRSQKFGSKI